MIFYSDPHCSCFHEKAWYHSLRSKAWKHPTQESFEVWNQSRRPWLWLLFRQEHLHIHIEQVLLCTGDHSRSWLWASYRHVEFRMHCLRVLNRNTNFPRAEWERPDQSDNGILGSASKATSDESEKDEALFWRGNFETKRLHFEQRREMMTWY